MTWFTVTIWAWQVKGLPKCWTLKGAHTLFWQDRGNRVLAHWILTQNWHSIYDTAFTQHWHSIDTVQTLHSRCKALNTMHLTIMTCISVKPSSMPESHRDFCIHKVLAAPRFIQRSASVDELNSDSSLKPRQSVTSSTLQPSTAYPLWKACIMSVSLGVVVSWRWCLGHGKWKIRTTKTVLCQIHKHFHGVPVLRWVFRIVSSVSRKFFESFPPDSLDEFHVKQELFDSVIVTTVLTPWPWNLKFCVKVLTVKPSPLNKEALIWGLKEDIKM